MANALVSWLAEEHKVCSLVWFVLIGRINQICMNLYFYAWLEMSGGEWKTVLDKRRVGEAAWCEEETHSWVEGYH